MARVAGSVAGQHLEQAVHLRLLARDPRPAFFSLQPRGPRLELLGRVSDWIGAHRDKVNVTSYTVAEGRLQSRDTLTDSRAHVRAARKDEADDDHLAFNEVGVEAQLLSVLVEAVDIGYAWRGGGLGRVGLVLVHLLRTGAGAPRSKTASSDNVTAERPRARFFRDGVDQIKNDKNDNIQVLMSLWSERYFLRIWMLPPPIMAFAASIRGIE